MGFIIFLDYVTTLLQLLSATPTLNPENEDVPGICTAFLSTFLQMEHLSHDMVSSFDKEVR